MYVSIMRQHDRYVFRNNDLSFGSEANGNIHTIMFAYGIEGLVLVIGL